MRGDSLFCWRANRTTATPLHTADWKVAARLKRLLSDSRKRLLEFDKRSGKKLGEMAA
ncbi:hypothetical protein THTE_2379 [Thermogutta terrifontis]|uniref:Uncharacterized protein n=1 Tax=Thermogutta terrifontis TaxID=1331910 RepID=A0A286RG91_9BACT|nr:hypothetical protein THTE_2379 [Thermogutta terrifontis]